MMLAPAARLRLNQYEKQVHTPGEAASLVAGGCGCEDEDTGTFALENPEAPVSEVTWAGVIGTEGEMTGDGRLIELNALRWEDLPLPLRYAPVDNGGHDGAVVVGRILTVERRDNGDLWGTGDIDMGAEFGPEAARVIANGTNNGVSMDLDSVSFEIRVAAELLEDMNEDLAEDPPQVEPVEPGTDDEGRVTVMEINAGDEVFVTTDGRVRAATVVSIPAFNRARINLDDAAAIEAAPAAPALVAGGSRRRRPPVEPPAEWFQDPVFTALTPLTITEDGRIYGHLAAWGTCHTGFSGQCVEPPHSPSGYAYFHTGATLTSDGTEVSTGRLTLDTLHAGRTLNATDTLAHYEHTGKAAADVRVGEDAFGIWFAGAVRPGMSPERIRTLRAAPISGDWRRIGTGLELVAALGVNSPGFPVPRPQGLVASGSMLSLVASGVVDPTEVPIQPELPLDMDALADRIAQRMETRARSREAARLAARTRTQRARTLAQRVGMGTLTTSSSKENR